MGNATNDKPKCLLEIQNNKTILEAMLENLLTSDVKELVMTVTYLHNTDFENNNNAFSLWMTRDTATGPIFLLDSDIVFDQHILNCLLEYPETDCLAVRTKDSIGEEEMKVSLQPGTKKIAAISKKIDPKTAFGESIGIELFSPEFLKELYPILDRRIVKENRINEYYEDSFQEMIDKNNPIYAVDIGSKKAAEIDFIEDLESAKKNILPFI
jgi:choline kinase